MEYIEMKYKVEKFLEDNGFIKIDYNIEGQDIWRQKDNEPKMDIVIDFIEHKDNL
jgi:hypothetical protein